MHYELAKSLLFVYICNMNKPSVRIYEHASDLPPMVSTDYFHSPDLMLLCERTPRHKPYMAVLSDGEGRVAAHMLAVVRYKRSWLPPWLVMHLRVMGDGEYDGDEHRQEWFGMMVDALVGRFGRRAFYMEFSHLSHKMFGYKKLRTSGFFPVKWMNIHNSLHSRSPEERILPRQKRHIETALGRGVVVGQVETEQDFKGFDCLLHQHNWLRPWRYVPDGSFFRGLVESGRGRLYIAKYRDRVIGCCACVMSGGDAYLWYSSARGKSYAPFYPRAVTVWQAILDASASGMAHIRFVDVGLPLRKNPYRDFILRFGGKEVSGYRWFRISIPWVNSVASWVYRE